MIVSDASVWVSVLRVKDIYHQKTVAWLEKYAAEGGEIFAPTLLMAEVSGAIARRTEERRLGRLALERLMGYDFLHILPVNEELAVIASEVAAHCRLRGADAVYAALAYQLNVPLLTWDLEQIARLRTVIQAGTPEDDLGNNGHSGLHNVGPQ